MSKGLETRGNVVFRRIWASFTMVESNSCDGAEVGRWGTVQMSLRYVDTSRSGIGDFLVRSHLTCRRTTLVAERTMSCNGTWWKEKGWRSSQLKWSQWKRRDDRWERYIQAKKESIILVSSISYCAEIKHFIFNNPFCVEGTLFNINVATPAFCPLEFACCTHFHAFTSNISLSLCLRCVSWNRILLDLKKFRVTIYAFQPKCLVFFFFWNLML